MLNTAATRTTLRSSAQASRTVFLGAVAKHAVPATCTINHRRMPIVTGRFLSARFITRNCFSGILCLKGNRRLDAESQMKARVHGLPGLTEEELRKLGYG